MELGKVCYQRLASSCGHPDLVTYFIKFLFSPRAAFQEDREKAPVAFGATFTKRVEDGSLKISVNVNKQFFLT